MRFQYYRDREGNQKNIGSDIARTHGDELRITLTTFCSRVWSYLPVFEEWLTFSKSRDYHGDEGHNKEPSDELKAKFIGPFPYLTCEAFKELRDGEFGNP